MPLHIIISINIIEEGKMCKTGLKNDSSFLFRRELGRFLNKEDIFNMKFYLFFWALHKIYDFLKISFLKVVWTTDRQYIQNVVQLFIYIMTNYS